jgi:hypothetical protein
MLVRVEASFFKSIFKFESTLGMFFTSDVSKYVLCICIESSVSDVVFSVVFRPGGVLPVF